MIKDIKISTKLYILVCLTSFTILVIGIYGLYNLNTVNNSLESVYKDRVIPLKQLKVISDMYNVEIVNSAQKIRNGNIDFKEGKRNVKKGKAAIENNWKNYLASDIDPEEQKVAGEIQELMKNSEESMASLESIL